MTIDPVVLDGTRVRLEPINESHREGLCAAISDGELWKIFVTIVPHPDDIDEFLANAKIAQETGTGLAFATIDKRTGDRVAGSTRFMNASLPNKRLEIGFTFLGQTRQRSPINTEAKLSMLTHAFETLDLNRVELMTDYLNSTSRARYYALEPRKKGYCATTW